MTTPNGLRPNAHASASNILIIGNGRLARHLRHYLDLESRAYTAWNRKSQSEDDLKTLAAEASHLALAVSDPGIVELTTLYPWLSDKPCVHFSGALVHPNVPSAHPLMTFADELYDLQTYRAVPFVLEKGRGDLNSLLPGLTNASFEIEAKDKNLYHAWCAMTGNFTTLLWENAFKVFEEKLHLPKSILLPYLAQTTWNVSSSPSGKSVLTGPIARGDAKTIQNHLSELKRDSNGFDQIYEAFLNVVKLSDSKPDPKEKEISP